MSILDKKKSLITDLSFHLEKLKKEQMKTQQTEEII